MNFKNISDQVSVIMTTGEKYWYITFGICALLVIIHIINSASGGKLNVLGIIPRHILGLPGVVCSPFLHGDSGHLILNLFPLFILMNLVLLQGVYAFSFISIVFILGSGILTWLFGKRAIHVGASSVIMAYWGFLLVSAFTTISVTTFVVGFICLYFFGNFILSIVPQGDQTSWEGHLFGLIVGVAFGYAWFVKKGVPIQHAVYAVLNLFGVH